jgi:hypothetical protein
MLIIHLSLLFVLLYTAASQNIEGVPADPWRPKHGLSRRVTSSNLFFFKHKLLSLDTRQEECPTGYSTKTLGSFILEDLTLTVVTMQSHVAASRTAAQKPRATVYVDIIFYPL